MTPTATLQAILDAARVERAVYAVTTLDLPDRLATGPRAVAALAEATGTRAPLLARLLRLLVAAGVLSEPQPGSFGLTPVGDLLRRDVPGSLRPRVLQLGASWQWHRQPGDVLVEALRTGDTAFDRVMGMPFFAYLAAEPEAGAVFDAAMTSLTRGMLGLLPRHYDFTEVGTVVDVGGGEGELLLDLLAHAPAARGILFDQPQVVARANARIAAAGMVDRCTAVGGDFFANAVPSGGDVYLLKMVLHDWADDRASAILGACRRAMGPHSRLLLVERVVPAMPPYALEPLLMDITMLLQLGSRERTETEWHDLLAVAGFRLTRVIPTAGPLSLIEGRPQ
jgi:hypothetical protein